MWDRWDGKSMCLNGRPLVGHTANKARDPFLLHLTLHSLPEGIILWGTSAGVGEANDELTPGNIAICNNPTLVEISGATGNEIRT